MHQHCNKNSIEAEDCVVSKMLMNSTDDLLYILNQASMFDMLDLDCQVGNAIFLDLDLIYEKYAIIDILCSSICPCVFFLWGGKHRDARDTFLGTGSLNLRCIVEMRLC